MDSLALAYRPRTFDDLVGQRAVQVILRQMVAVNKVPHALLFDGSRGTGKTTTARILAAALNCQQDNKPCGQCPSCIATFDGSSLDVLEIDAASNGHVDDVRALRQQLLYRQSGNYRVVIFDEAHSASGAAFNAWLKTLEEPPPNTVVIMLTTEPHKIPDTILSRCMAFTFRRLTIADITARLQQIADAENITLEPGLLKLIAERADGAMRDAVMLLDQISRVGITTAEQYQRLTGHTDEAPTLLSLLIKADIAATFAHLDDMLTRVADPNAVANDIVSVLRDVLVLRSGGDITKTGVALAQRQNLALTLDTSHVLAALKVLWQLKTNIRVDDARANLELVIVMLSEVFHGMSTRTTSQRMSLTDMAKTQ